MSGTCLYFSTFAFNAVSIRAVLATALAVCLIPIGTARADLFWPHYRSWGWGGSKPFRQKHGRAHRKHEPERKAKSEEVAKGALQVIISIADQRVSVYDDGTLIARSSVSTGVKGHSTPLGVFSVNDGTAQIFIVLPRCCSGSRGPASRCMPGLCRVIPRHTVAFV
jgi:L,D-transpeptidase catalytic domain